MPPAFQSLLAALLITVLLTGEAFSGWLENRASATDLLAAGQVDRAYALVTGARVADRFLHEKEFLSGVVATAVLGRPDVAHGHFVRAIEPIAHLPASRRPRAAAKTGYWIGRVLERMGNVADAAQAYAAAAAHPTTWYGQMAAARLGQRHDLREWRDSSFPILDVHWRDPRVSSSFVHAVIRTESNFRTGAVSVVGAKGLMQVMDGTARAIGRSIGMPIDVDAMRTNPDYNVAVGSHFLARMAVRYGGDQLLAAAAYNAGPGAVDQWITRLGDPRTHADRATWVELIPYRETRHYVKKVLAAERVYRDSGV